LHQGLLPTETLHLLVWNLMAAASIESSMDSIAMQLWQKGTQQAIHRRLGKPRLYITAQAMAAEDMFAALQLVTICNRTVAKTDLTVICLL